LENGERANPIHLQRCLRIGRRRSRRSFPAGAVNHYRQLHGDSSALTGRTLDAALAAQQSGSLSNAGHAKMAFPDLIGLESDSLIANHDPNLIALLHQFDPYLLALAVPASIVQRLLGDAIDGVLQ
jgi:hypothetical protein